MVPVTITPEMHLSDIVNDRPDLARQLEAWGLDYCCGGRRRLDDACAERGLDAVLVATELTGTTGPTESEPAWTTMDATALVDHVESTHHRYLADELPRLGALADKVVAVHGERHPELRTVLATLEALRCDLEPHLRKEEQVLFPMIRELAASDTAPVFHCGTLANPIGMMEREHETTGALLVRLRAVTGDYRAPGDACGSYEALYAGLADLESDTHLHVHKENNVLFPMVLRLEEARR